MKRGINYQALNLLGSILLLIGVVAGFYWLWSRTSHIKVKTASSKYQTIEIDSLKKDAAALVAGKSNLSGMPLQAPSSDQVGRDNPFLVY